MKYMNGVLMRKSQLGLTIVELMIAMVLGLILSAGIIQVFLANRQSQRVEQAVSRVQENGRIALDMLTKDLRQAGFFGCAAPIEISDNVKVAPTTFFYPKAKSVSVSSTFTPDSVRGYQRSASGSWSPALPSDLSTTAVASAQTKKGSDAIAVYYATDFGARVNAGADASGASDVVVDNPAGAACFAKDDVVLVSNCATADLIKVTNTPDCSGATVALKHDSTGNTDANLGGSYSSASMSDTSASRPRVMQFVQNVYFVADTQRKNAANQNIFSLYRYANGSAQELVEGIEFLKVEFGEKLSTGNIRYIAANDASIDWANVVSVRIGLLAQSYETVRDSDDSSSYTIADQAISASTHGGGRSLRQAYTATIELRNHLQ